MPSWKKVIISGSSAELSSLNAPSITGSLQGTSSFAVTASYANTASFVTPLIQNVSLTGSLNMPGIVSPGSANAKIHVANYPNPAGSLTAGTGSVLYNYGVYKEGLILQYGYFGDQGGIKITDDGVAVFGAGDMDILKVIDEDFNVQRFSINEDGYVGINKTGVTGSSTPTNATLDVNGDTIITGSLTVTAGITGTASFASFATSASSAATASFITPLNQNVLVTGSLNVTTNITSSRLLITGSTPGSLVTITQTGTGNAFVVQDANPDFTPFVIDTSGSVGIGVVGATPSTYSSKLYFGIPEYSGFSAIKAYGNNNHAIIATGKLGYAAIYGEGVAADGSGTVIGVYGNSYSSGDPYSNTIYIGGKFEASATDDFAQVTGYSVQLKDGTEAKGKVLVSQDASGSANWSTQLSGSYGLTGSLIISASGATNDLRVGTNKLFVSASGNIGIGTIIPTSASLVVNSSGSTSTTYIAQFQGGGTQRFNFTSDGIMYWGLSAIPSNANGYLSWDIGKAIVGSAGSTNNLSFTAGLGERMFISSSGLIGIGTTTPSASLHINNITTNNSFLVEDSTNPDTTPFVIDSSGSVGMGTLTPQTVLHVKANPSSTQTATIRVESDTVTANSSISYYSGGVNRWEAGTGISLGAPYEIYDRVAGQTRFSITTAGASVFSNGNVGIGTTTPNAKLDVSGSAIISGSLTTTSSVAFKAYTSDTSFPGTAAGYLAFDSSGNIITVAGAGSAINIGNTDLTITSNAIRTLSHAGTSRFIITGSNQENSILELHSSTTGLGRGLFMTQLINAEPERTAVRATTAGGNNADSITHNGWASDHLVEYVSGSGIAPSQLKGWKWSYFNGSAYKDVLIVSTSNAATISGSLTVTGSISFKGLSSATTSDVVYIDTATGALSYGAGGGGSAFPYTGSAQITGSLGLTGSLNIYYSGSKNDYPVYITNKTADVAQYINYDVDVAPASNRVASWIQATATGSANSLTGHQIRVITKGASGTALGQDIVAKYDGETPAGKYAIGMMVVAEGGAYNHALRLIDGSQGAGKVLTCLYNNDGFASWVDPVPAFPYNGDAVIDGTLSVTTGGITGSLQGTASFATSASYAATASYVTGAVAVAAFPYTGSAQITGSLGLTGSLHMPSIEATGVNFAKIHIAKHPQPAGDLPASPGSILYDYGGDSEGLILQYGTGTDEGGIKITDDGVAVFGAGDKDVFKVIDEDLNEQRFSINNAGLVGINKPGVAGVYTPTNAILDVNGDTIITGSLKVTHNLQGDLGTSIDTNALIQSGLLYLSNNF